MKIFRSKIDWWLSAIVFLPFGFVIYQLIKEENKQWSGLPVAFITILLIIYLFSALKYIIQEEFLIVKIGIFSMGKIDVKTIRKIYKTRNPLSSPALSINRIAIVYNKYDEVLLSPKNRQEFIDELLKINPNIEVKI